MRSFTFVCSLVSFFTLFQVTAVMGILPRQSDSTSASVIVNDARPIRAGPSVIINDRTVTVRVKVGHLLSRLARQRGYTIADVQDNDVPVLQEVQYQIGRELTLDDELEFKLSTRLLRQRDKLMKVVDNALLHDMHYVMVRFFLLHLERITQRFCR